MDSHRVTVAEVCLPAHVSWIFWTVHCNNGCILTALHLSDIQLVQCWCDMNSAPPAPIEGSYLFYLASVTLFPSYTPYNLLKHLLMSTCGRWILLSTTLQWSSQWQLYFQEKNLYTFE